MPFVSLTRLRLRSIRFVPQFGIYAIRTRAQCQRAAGFLDGALLADRSFTFWTLTAWDTEASMRAYMVSGDHKRAMPRLMHWCDEASVTHWTQEDGALPSWTEADARMRGTGRISKVLHPSKNHAAMTYRAPRTTRGGPIPRAK